MGHQIHFLSRLERVDGKALEWALKLYNHAQVRDIITATVLPEPRPDRFAIALDEGDEPPHVVLTGEGRFVTCLGPGMKPYDLMVIPYSRLKGFDLRMDQIGASLDALAANEVRSFEEIERKMLASEELLSREDFLEATVWQPLMLEQLVKSMLRAYNVIEVRDEQQASSPMNKLRKFSDKALRSYWKMACMSGPFAQLVALDVPSLRRWVKPLTMDPWLSWQAVRHFRVAGVLRGLWAAGKIGPSLVPGYKKVLDSKSDDFLEILDAAGSLTVIGLRHRKSIKEIRKCLDAHAQGPGKIAQSIGLFSLILANSDHIRNRISGICRSYLVALGEYHPVGSPYRFKDVSEVPDELVTPALTLLGGRVASSQHATQVVTFGLTLVAQAKAEDLYMPQDYLDSINLPPMSRRDIVKHMRKQAEYFGKPRVAKSDVKPGRNAPCSCGSGKKYKKCCGRN